MVTQSFGFLGHCFLIEFELSKKYMVIQSLGFLGHCFLIIFELPKNVQPKNKKAWVTKSFGFFGL